MRKYTPQFADPKGVLVADTAGNGLLAAGTTVPADATAGYAAGCVFMDTDGSAGAQFYVNQGTSSSCAFKALPTLAATGALVLAVAGVAAGYKVARGQATTATASDTVVTGLATVVSAVASLDSDPVDDPFMCTCSIGDQAGSPAAGSILIKTWKNTGGTDPTPTAATTFSKKVNWIAVGT